MMRSRSLIATPPGATIREQLDDRDMSQKELAARMALSEKHVSKLINGEVQLTPEVAVKLETVLGVPAKFWNNLEAIYREKLVKAEAENSMDTDEALAQKLPYNEMAGYGWVPETGNGKEKAVNLRKYFEVVELSLLENRQIMQIACRRLAVTEKSDFALLAWVQAVKLKARSIETAPVSHKALLANLSAIRGMTTRQPDYFCPEIKALMAGCGIALVFLPHLKGSFLQGATFLEGNKIVVGLTARGKDADKFWFSLFHELGHIILGHVDRKEGTTEREESDADEWSRDRLIPAAEFAVFKEKRDYSRKAVRDFAQLLGIAPGIVVGRLQNEGLVKHSVLNDLKEHYSIAV